MQRSKHLQSIFVQMLLLLAVLDDVEVTGVVRAQWRPLFPGARCDGSLTIKACNVRSINSRHRAVVPAPEGLQEQFR